MQRGNFFFLCAFVSYLISTVLLQLLVELQGDADHHFGLVPIGVGDVVQDAIEVCGRNEKIKRVMIEGGPPPPTLLLPAARHSSCSDECAPLN